MMGLDEHGQPLDIRFKRMRNMDKLVNNLVGINTYGRCCPSISDEGVSNHEIH